MSPLGAEGLGNALVNGFAFHWRSLLRLLKSDRLIFSQQVRRGRYKRRSSYRLGGKRTRELMDELATPMLPTRGREAK